MTAKAKTTLFLCGDVMTGRGIDQVLAHPCAPQLHERYMRSAAGYVRLAEDANGPIGAPRDYAYVWGDALAELDRVQPDARIANLETAVTVSDDAWPGKAVHYRMHPANVPVLSAARLDCCVLANNHVMDWGRQGLDETLASLRQAGLRTAGAGADAREAEAPAVIAPAGGARVLVFAVAMASSGVPPDWAAAPGRPGVALLEDLSSRSLEAIARRIEAHRLPGDVVVLSIHRGGNWGYDVGREERQFAHGLVQEAGVDVVHGHSSHHPRGIEIHHERLILQGCGDFINDYEGIAGWGEFRPELVLMYFPSLDAHGALLGLHLEPLRMRRFRLERARPGERAWLADMLRRESARLGTRLDLLPEVDLAMEAP